jgi:hypothetical protein
MDGQDQNRIFATRDLQELQRLGEGLETGVGGKRVS